MININLIMPTLGRSKEVFEYINSLRNSSEIELYKINLYIMDQNNNDLLSILEDYAFDKVNEEVIKSKIRGLSLNRNIGLHNTISGLCAFPDDDCLYYENTLRQVTKFFKENIDVDIVLGRIFDRNTQKNIIKNWPDKEVIVNKFNFYHLSSSITIFLRDKPNILFDDRLGAGAEFGSCEDPDFLYRLLQQGKKIVYTPSIDVWHPTPDESTISLDKVNSYASGFGAFIRKDFALVKLYLLLGCVAKKCFQCLFMNKSFKKGYFKAFFTGLYKGITQF